MRYRNASDIFPDELLKEIQKYSAGELIYIPEKSEKKKWGEMRKSDVSIETENRYLNWLRNTGFPVIRSEEFYTDKKYQVSNIRPNE